MQFATTFQLMTLTSASCVLTRSAGVALRAFRASQTQTTPSAPHEAKTCASAGDHCRSSTELSCPRNTDASSTAHRPPSLGSHTWIPPALSPVASLASTVGDQSRAYPSSACPVKACRGADRWGCTFIAACASLASAVSIESLVSCGDMSQTCTTPVSPHVATKEGLLGQARMRFTAPWCAIFCTWMIGPLIGAIPPSSSSESDSLASLSSSMSVAALSTRLVFLSRVRRIIVRWFLCATSAWVPAIAKSEWGNRSRVSPSSSRRMSKERHGQSSCHACRQS
mmetsp:Transcript_5668/g.23375  ORF Transcript_5668/g.23375 Transcript_5668/m.23375 type:complete len:282 (+) Transcript_5668:518-1363(+)